MESSLQPSRRIGGLRAASGHRLGAWHQRAKVDDETVRFVRELREEGFSYNAISMGTGIPIYTIRDWVTFRTRSSA